MIFTLISFKYDDAEDDDHVFRKHVGDDGLLHREHLPHHDVTACNRKPVNMNYVVIFCEEIALFTFHGLPRT